MAVSRDHVSGSYSQVRQRRCKANSTPSVDTEFTLRARIGRAIKRTVRLASLTAMATVTIGFSGCCFFGGGSGGGGFGSIDTFMDKQVSCMRDRVWAKRAFHLQYGHCQRVHADHFRDGFIAGYCNVCEGGTGECPAMPPERYWGFQYQNQEGADMQNAWFAGYESGAGSAHNDGSGAFREIQISREVEQLMLVDQAIKAEHAGVRKSSIYGDQVVIENPAGLQNAIQAEMSPPMMVPRSNSPMAIPGNSWQRASSQSIPQQPLPMQMVPNEIPIIVGPSQR